MVAQDLVTAWDLKPNRENTNQIFNVLCNVQPVEHPWSGEGHLRQTDVTEGSKQQYWFEKCKGLKKCKLYRYTNAGGEISIEEMTGKKEEQGWENANFTDVILFQGYRLYMRRNSVFLNPYGETYKGMDVDGKYVQYEIGTGDGNPNTCDNPRVIDDVEHYYRPSDIMKHDQKNSDKTAIQAGNSISDGEYIASTHTRIYIQQVNTDGCSGDSYDNADESPIILIREYESSECNPDHFVMGYGGIGIPNPIQAKSGEQIKIAMIYFGANHFAYLYGQKNRISATEWVSLSSLGMYVTGLTEPTAEGIEMLVQLGLPLDGYFIPQVSELSQSIKIPQELAEGDDYEYEITEIGDLLWAYNEYGEVPYIVAGTRIYSINGFYSLKSTNTIQYLGEKALINQIYRGGFEDRTRCSAYDVDEGTKRRIFVFDNMLYNATNKYVITGLERWGARLCYVANNYLYVSGQGILNGQFTTLSGDASRGAFTIPAGITDVKAMYGSLLLFGPKAIYAIQNQEALIAGNFINATENEDGYYSPGSFYNDDGEFLIVRRGKLLETLQFSAYYGTVQFTPDTGFYINGHIKPLNNKYDMINIDATINHRYISIFDDNIVGPHYSKLLIYDKHYNCWYHWVITGARIVHVKDGIFLGDGVYVNKGRTWGWKDDDTEGGEIIEIISAYVGEEGLQTPKQIQFVKTAIGDHSVITSNSKWDINLSFGGRLFERRNDITATRHPQLLFLKNSTNTIKDYQNGEQIYGHGEQHQHTLLNEIAEYRHYDKFSQTIIREMGSELDSTSKLAMFASIKEPVNAPANVLELCISARKLDNVQFGSFYIGYYALDPDYEDIENTNIDMSDLSDRTSEYDMVMNKGEYCEEILAGSACDSPSGT